MMTVMNSSAIKDALQLLSSLTAEDLMALQIAHQKAEKMLQSSRAAEITKRSPLTAEERKERRNARQRALRATPEGKAANAAASKRSLQAKKHAQEVREFLAERVTEYLNNKGMPK